MLSIGTSSSKMWFVVICLLAAVTSGRTEYVLGRGNIDYKNIFEDRMRKELESTRVSILPSDKLPRTADIVGIEDQDMIFLRDLRLLQDPVLRITSLDSTLSLFSTRIGIDFDNMFFAGRIYINDDTTPVGDVRFTLRNVKASGHVGFDLPGRGRLISTNYYIKYENDSPHHLEIESRDERLTKSIRKFLAKRLKRGIIKVMDAMLKRRIDTALSKIPIADIYGTGDVEGMKAGLDDVDYDAIVDKILRKLNNQIAQDNKIQLYLPDVSPSLTYTVGILPITAQFELSGGWMRNFASFARRGSVSVSHDAPDNALFFSDLGLEKLEFGYDKCSVTVASLGFLPSVEDLTGTIRKNKARIGISIDKKNKTITLEDFAISELSDVDLTLSGLGIPFNWVAAEIAEWFGDGLMTDVVPTIEPVIRDQISETLKVVDVSELLGSSVKRG